MKINTLETHDRLLQFNRQADYISEGCQDCIRNRPPEFGNHPFYIFAHKRVYELDERMDKYNLDIQKSFVDLSYKRIYFKLEDVPTARLIWTPRLSKPQAQENSMLFKAYPPSDNIKVIWMLPDRALWGQFNQGDMIENDTVKESINAFLNCKGKLEEREDDDISDDEANAIYKEMAINKKGKGNIDFKLRTLAASQSFLT